MSVYPVLLAPDDPEYGSDWPVAAFTDEGEAQKYADTYPAPKGTCAVVHEPVPLDPKPLVWEGSD